MIEAIVTNETAALGERMAAWSRMVGGQMLKDVAELVSDQARERIESGQASPDGEPWPARKHEYPHPMLRRTGAMLRSIRKRRQGVNAYLAGVAKEYAKYHHTGTRRMAARPFVGVGRQDSEEIDDLLHTFVELRF